MAKSPEYFEPTVTVLSPEGTAANRPPFYVVAFIQRVEPWEPAS